MGMGAQKPAQWSTASPAKVGAPLVLTSVSRYAETGSILGSTNAMTATQITKTAAQVAARLSKVGHV